MAPQAGQRGAASRPRRVRHDPRLRSRHMSSGRWRVGADCVWLLRATTREDNRSLGSRVSVALPAARSAPARIDEVQSVVPRPRQRVPAPKPDRLLGGSGRAAGALPPTPIGDVERASGRPRRGLVPEGATVRWASAAIPRGRPRSARGPSATSRALAAGRSRRSRCVERRRGNERVKRVHRGRMDIGEGMERGPSLQSPRETPGEKWSPRASFTTRRGGAARPIRLRSNSALEIDLTAR